MALIHRFPQTSETVLKQDDHSSPTPAKKGAVSSSLARDVY